MSFIRTRAARSLQRWGLAISGAAALALAGCGFQPVHGEGSAASNVGLANFDIAIIKDRTGQMMRNEMLRQMQPRGAVRSPRFKLSVSLTEARTSLAIKKNAVATRANLILDARYVVVDKADGAQLLSAQAQSVNSYNILTSDFATLSAREDARKRAVLQLARNIKERLAVWLIQTEGRPVVR